MDIGRAIRTARLEAGFTQAELARRAGTSQATLSAYENAAKRPTLETLDRLLAECGRGLGLSGRDSREVSSATLKERGRILAEVLAFAETFPARRRGPLRYPPLHTLRAVER